MGPYRKRPQDPIAAQELGRACGVGATTAQILLHRGIDDESSARDFLLARLGGLTSPEAMVDRDLAAERLARAVRAKERVVVFGDYDVDGATSAAILSDVLEALGGDVRALVANRFDGGYGFSDAALARCRDAGAQLIVTCDCGSSDHERIASAKAAGIEVIVVDHHLVPDEPLPAFAFLNPHRPECGFPYKGLASAGLAFSVGAAVRRALGVELDLRAWLDLVALGTVADVAPLDGDNRRLVRAGLALLSGPDARPGVAALREVAAISGPVGAVDISFRLAPRLNAAGRLGDPTVTLELLKARTAGEARGLAARIERLNSERKEIERQVTQSATEQVAEIYGASPEHGIVVAGQGWHRGVVGITAARLVDRFGVPCVVIGIDGDEGHGSGRTPHGFPLYDAISACAPTLRTFGGHQAAAGVTIDRGRVDAFRADFSGACARLWDPSAEATGPLVDVELDGDRFGLPSVRDLFHLEPLGEGNAEPLFALPRVRVERATAVGKGAHLKLSLRVGGRSLSAFGYQMGEKAHALPEVIDVLGHIRADRYRGGDAVELRLLDLGP